MEAIVERCAGLDVHQASVVVCVLRAALEQKPKPELRSFGTTTNELLELADWLAACQVTVVAMESTGVFWKPVWNILEGYRYQLILANARKIKNVPGRKTDQKDAEWIAQLLRCGLVERSFVPSVEQRDLRDLTRRRRRMLQEMTREKNRVHKILQDANIKLTSVVSNLFGVSGRALLTALVAQKELDAESIAAVVKGPLKQKLPALQQALIGRVRSHHLMMIRFSMEHFSFLEAQVAALEAQIEDRIRPFRAEQALLCAIPGLDRAAAAEVLAELGSDMAIFPSEAHVSSWTGLSPGNFESAGKSKAGRTGPGNRWLKSTLVQCAWAASHAKDSRLAGRFWRLARRSGRNGAKKAAVATAHTILRLIYYTLSTHHRYVEYGAAFGTRSVQTRAQKLAKELERLGYTVTKAA